ncbi:hypothetical protein D3C83_96010 [compost metagenome]
MQGARRRAQRHVEQRHDHPAVHRAEAVGELRLHRQRELRRAFAELLGQDLQVLDERDLLLVVPRKREAVVHRKAFADPLTRGS